MTASIWDPSTPAGAVASTVPFDPTVTLAATNVQAAIEEADTENRALSLAVRTDLASTASGNGAALVGYLPEGAGAVGTTVQAKLREQRSAYDDGARGVSTVTDSAAIQAGCAIVNTAGGGTYRINSFVAQSIDLSALALPTTVQIIDDRYSESGWTFVHNEGVDAQFGLRGRASAAGEGPAVVLQNIASTGNRNASIVHWYGPTNAPVVASFEHWGYNADSTWYAGREYLTKGSIDTGSRARTRHGNDGGIVFNPNGDALSYRNNPASAFGAGYHFVFQAPLQSTYTYSGKYLLGLANAHIDVPLELRLQTDTGESGASVTNPTLKFMTGIGPSAVNRFALLGEYPSATQFSLYDYIASKSAITYTSNTGCSFGVAVYPAQDTKVLQTATGIYAGTGVPNNANGNNGDFYFRGDTPGTALQRVYIKAAGAWTGIL